MYESVTSLFVSLYRSLISNPCEDDHVYVHAISDARCVFDMGVSEVLYFIAGLTV